MLPKHRPSTLASLVIISGLLFRPRTRMRFGLAIRNTVPPFSASRKAYAAAFCRSQQQLQNRNGG
jgi:uncharacterized membrane protein YdfJ with MMPL/SSD domain